jgi:hypothetical protein
VPWCGDDAEPDHGSGAGLVAGEVAVVRAGMRIGVWCRSLIALMLVLATNSCSGSAVVTSPTSEAPTIGIGSTSAGTPTFALPITTSVGTEPSDDLWTAAPPPGTTWAASAADQLVPFIAAVAQTDRFLRAAADAVNAGVGADTITFSQATIDAVERSAPTTAATAIPAGLEPAVEQAVLLVYSDLVSRYAALHGDSCLPRRTIPRSELNPRCFTQGHAAAIRLTADVDAARTLAAASPPVTAPAADSRTVAELLLRIAFIDKANLGCDQTGGFLAIDAIRIDWNAEPPPAPDVPPTDGHIGTCVVLAVDICGIPFRATYNAETGWTVDVVAC